MHSDALYHWFRHPDYLWLVFVLPVLSVLSIIAARRQRRRLLRFGRMPALLALAAQQRQWRGLRWFGVSMALSLLAIGIAGPQWGREPGVAVAAGRDLVVVLDLSRSMLADDVLPSRFRQARRAIEDLAANLQERGGHRVALVAFAGRARIVCPLTHDYDHFRNKLEELDAAHLPPELRATPITGSGTRIGAALELAVAAHDQRFRGAGVQDIVLLSDGDDPAGDNEWFNGILAAQEAGIPVHTLGIGIPDMARPIPAGEEGYLKHQGKLVETRLQPEPLKTIADQTQGIARIAGKDRVPLVDLFRRDLEPGRKREAVDEAPPVYRQRYPWFFAVALFLLALEMVIGKGRKRSKHAGEPPRQPGAIKQQGGGPSLSAAGVR